MNYRGYPERDLVSNRSSLLIFGGSEADRRAWAEEAAQNFEGEGPVRVAGSDSELLEALKVPRGVVYVPDVAAIGTVAQSELVRVLRTREERPKVVVGVSGSPDTARDQGRIRTDLHYALSLAQVNLADSETSSAIAARRAKAAARRPAVEAKSSSKASSRSASKTPSKPASKGRKAAPAARSRPAARAARTATARKPARKSAPRRR